jgi:hypothetical protein
MYATQGRKLLSWWGGGTFRPIAEWNHDTELDWTLLDTPDAGIQRLGA